MRDEVSNKEDGEIMKHRWLDDYLDIDFVDWDKYDKKGDKEDDDNDN